VGTLVYARANGLYNDKENAGPTERILHGRFCRVGKVTALLSRYKNVPAFVIPGANMYLVGRYKTAPTTRYKNVPRTDTT